MTLNLQVTLRKLTLGAPDSVTGWYTKTFTEQPRAREVYIVERGSTKALLPPGSYVRTDALGLTCDGFEEGDEIKTENGVYYEVKAERELFFLNSFDHREVDLVKLPLHEMV